MKGDEKIRCDHLFPLTSSLLSQTQHGFFTREGGVSSGFYESLNCSLPSKQGEGQKEHGAIEKQGDKLENLIENRRRVATYLGVEEICLLGAIQVHGNKVLTATQSWALEDAQQADAVVTCESHLALSVITADCAPVLFSTTDGKIIGAAHAGWRGTLAGVLEATCEAMVALGAVRSKISAVIGPCIAQESYEIAEDMRRTVLAEDKYAVAFFAPSTRLGHYWFDLAGWCVSRLHRAGIGEVRALNVDTFSDEKRFFSYRRSVLTHQPYSGRQISAITTRMKTL